MDKEDCIQVLLSTLQKPQWKSSNSVTDWDLKSILWQANLLLAPDLASALLADIRRRGLIFARERREDNRIVALWGVRLTPAGEEWLAHRVPARPVMQQGASRSPESSPTASTPEGDDTGPGDSGETSHAMEASLR